MGAHIFMDAIRWIGKLFHKSDNAEINVTDAVTKGVEGLNTIIDKFDEYKPLIEVAISNEGVGSIENVEAEIKAARDKFAEIKELPDIADKLVDVKLADDPKRNDFYHNLLKVILTVIKDGHIDIAEATLVIATVIAFFKGN